jgi:thiol-disulfide isomerase/thioredoxin
MKFIHIACCFLVMMNGMQAQPCNKTFTLQGKINLQTGTAFLASSDYTTYFPGGHLPDSVKIVDGIFTFSGPICYPYGFFLVIKKEGSNIYMTEPFIIEPGIQSIICHADSIREIPIIQNNGTMELNRFEGSLQAMHLNQLKFADQRTKRNKYLLEYSKEHPGSYMVLWKLTDRLFSGYEPIYDSIYFSLADSLKNTYTGKVLGDRLRSAGKYAVGKSFPQLMLSDRTGTQGNVPSFNNGAKYILVDFWYSHCGACIFQFPVLKTIYNKYQAKGLDFIAISTDDAVHVDDWKKAIADNQLPWRQYLDLNGKEANLLGVEVFPSNFILDSSGKIIARNLDTADLAAFLQTNLQ